jgi:hypothetical protein
VNVFPQLLVCVTVPAIVPKGLCSQAAGSGRTLTECEGSAAGGGTVPARCLDFAGRCSLLAVRRSLGSLAQELRWFGCLPATARLRNGPGDRPKGTVLTSGRRGRTLNECEGSAAERGDGPRSLPRFRGSRFAGRCSLVAVRWSLFAVRRSLGSLAQGLRWFGCLPATARLRNGPGDRPKGTVTTDLPAREGMNERERGSELGGRSPPAASISGVAVRCSLFAGRCSRVADRDSRSLAPTGPVGVNATNNTCCSPVYACGPPRLRVWTACQRAWTADLRVLFAGSTRVDRPSTRVHCRSTRVDRVSRSDVQPPRRIV